jgi:hypothetical protein
MFQSGHDCVTTAPPHGVKVSGAGVGTTWPLPSCPEKKSKGWTILFARPVLFQRTLLRHPDNYGSSF